MQHFILFLIGGVGGEYGESWPALTLAVNFEGAQGAHSFFFKEDLQAEPHHRPDKAQARTSKAAQTRYWLSAQVNKFGTPWAASRT
ncbi:MAG: hypothetical protein ABIR35_10730 [Polaromonas sp.]